MARNPHKSWALFFAFLILLGIGYAAWTLWSIHTANREAAAREARELADLMAERDSLAALLRLDPCEARSRSLPKAKPQPRTVSNIAENIENACVFVVSSDGKTSLSTGTGFFVAPGYILTNKHVIRDINNKAFVTSKILGKPLPARIVAASTGKNQDYALLKVEPMPGAPDPVAFSKNVHKTEKVGAWGFPDLVGRNDPGYGRLMHGDITSAPELSYTEGVVSAILNRNPPIIVHTAPISPGNSGGPLVNQDGEVIGINTMITLDETSYRQASLALAAADLLQFLAANGINP